MEKETVNLADTKLFLVSFYMHSVKASNAAINLVGGLNYRARS